MLCYVMLCLYFIFRHFSHIMHLTENINYCPLQTTMRRINLRSFDYHFLAIFSQNTSPPTTHSEQPWPKSRILVIFRIRLDTIFSNRLIRLTRAIKNPWFSKSMIGRFARSLTAGLWLMRFFRLGKMRMCQIRMTEIQVGM